jgi:hypothetical protein
MTVILGGVYPGKYNGCTMANNNKKSYLRISLY